MNKLTRIVTTVMLAMVVVNNYAQTRYTMEDVLQMAKSQSPFSKQAETRKENRYWQYKFYKSDYNPQLRLSGNLPNYNQDYFQNVTDDGKVEFQSRERTDAIVNLGLQQPIFFTGGTLSVNTNLNKINDFYYDYSTWNGTIVNVRLDQPILNFNELRWNKMTEPLRFEESKRSYVEEMEFISQQAVDRFFTVLDAQINLQIAQFNLANNDTIYKIEQGRYNIGTTPKDKLLQAELQLLRSRQDVTSARINLQNSKLDLRSYIGLKNDDEFELVLPEEIPTLNVTVDEALQRAKDNRADFIAFERRKIEADREVAEARGQRFQINLSASYGLNNSGDELDAIYTDPLSQQRINVGFNIPVLDWGRNRARMRTALANQKLNDYVIAQDEIIFEQEIVTNVAQFEVLLSQIEITKKSDEVAQERYLVSQNRYLIGKIDITNLNIALNEKDAAKRSYVGALRSFWSSYYGLRRLTLYDFSRNQLLYTPEQKN
ncbi:MAG TPA: TolC family protein [Cyclobacteriaceae bacterium]|nr:TolC family protein [Cyclobacteriaceae bacterium]